VLVNLRSGRVYAGAAVLVALVLIATLAGFGRPARAASAAKPPPNPSDGQISAAQQEKSNLAAEVGKLGAEVAQVQLQINQLNAAEELAEQKLAYALQKLEEAKERSAAAAKSVAAASARVVAAQREYASSVSAAYMSGDIGGTTGSLLTASDPNVVLEQSALEQYEYDHQIDGIGNLKSATVAKSNAEAAARLAVQNQKHATALAAQAKREAVAAVQAAQAQEQQLQATLAAQQTALSQAQERLATLNNQRAAYVAWQKKQAEIRAAQERARKLAEARARAAALAAQRRAAAHQNNGGGGSVSFGPAPRPTGGSWTRAKADVAVNRAMRYLGWMYAWAGGNASGPTYGVCAGDGAFNDCHIIGFDCSGLTLYAWAPSIPLAHYAATQYWQAGSYHPSIGALRPGDLLFWSSNGTIAGIHHVAMYIGNGNVIQAPESGSPIQITPVGDVSWGYYGATRPLT
jgi:cell wall-associated NlpC family hydrolase